MKAMRKTLRVGVGRVLALLPDVGVLRPLSFTIATACMLAPTTAAARGYGMSGELWMEASGSYMPSGMPALDVSQSSTSSRPNGVNGSTPPFGFATGFFGARVGLDWVVSDRWVLPLVDFGLYGIMGMYSDTLASADGSFFRLHPAGSFMVDAELLGFGVRFKRRRWMFEATLKPGVALLAVPAAVADGKGFADIDPLSAVTPTLRASLSVCRRLDPMERICAIVTPNIYQWGWGNGGSIALRWELGS